MNRTSLKLKIAAGVALAWLVGPGIAAAQTTAFTYQGHLKQSGSAANGNFNMTFKLFDAVAAGTQQGSTLTFDGVGGNPAPVNVASGLFTVQLDFGVGPYTANQNRWLEIAVSGTTLTPRQPLTAAPAALNMRGINVDATGKVGIGTSTPAQKLSVAGIVQSTNGGFLFPDGTAQTTASTTGPGFWTSNGTHIYKNNVGNVGIGTTSPLAPLHVYSTTVNSGDNTAQLAAPGIGPNASHIHWGTTGDWYIRSASAGGNIIMQDTGGNVGIGTTTPTSPLTIRTSSGPFVNGVGWSQTDGTRELASIINSSGGWLGTRSNDSLNFYTNNSAPQVTLTTGGWLGVGTTAPVSPLTISTVSGGYGLIQTDGVREVGTYVNSSGGWLGTRSNHSLRFFTNNSGTQMTLTTAGNLGIGTSNPGARLEVFGTTRTNVLEILGADLAEKFPLSDDEQASPGTVVEIDPDQPGNLRVARGLYSPRVAGIVSGAGDLPVGAVLGRLPGNEDAPPIALSGRVWVKCDASIASISPGDMLTTSTTPGQAMKAIDRERSYGAVIGKAMTSLKRGECGLVLVLVNLQ